MRIPGYKHLAQGARWLRSRVQGRALILGYHRVSEAGSDPFALTVSPRNFAEQLSVVREVATPISLSELVQRLQYGELPQRAVALTMDDGYVDNLYNVRPVLIKYDLPATIFVVSGCLGREFWWDELERLIFTGVAAEKDLSLATGGLNIEWQAEANWGLQKQQEHLLRVLYRALRSLPEGERQKALERLRAWAGDGVLAEASHRALTATELKTLADCPLIEIGSHTHTHPILAALPNKEQQAEITQSKALLEAWTGEQVTQFSYPNGSLSMEAQAILRDVGFVSACTSNNDMVLQQTDPFSLPRFWVPNWDGKQFFNWFSKWV